jgi:ribosomal protein S18 acetylase RimI-like enzyme
MMDGITLRPATNADYAFMRVLYGSTRTDERPHFPFTDEQWEEFLDQQFAAQTAQYAQHYPTARFNIIERDGQPIGRFYVDVWPDQIRVVDIALLPAARGKGIGAAFMQQAIDEARAAGKAVTIHVEVYNPALHLYDRLGFKPVATSGAYYLMEWKPDQVKTAS